MARTSICFTAYQSPRMIDWFWTFSSRTRIRLESEILKPSGSYRNCKLRQMKKRPHWDNLEGSRYKTFRFPRIWCSQIIHLYKGRIFLIRKYRRKESTDRHKLTHVKIDSHFKKRLRTTSLFEAIRAWTYRCSLTTRSAKIACGEQWRVDWDYNTQHRKVRREDKSDAFHTQPIQPIEYTHPKLAFQTQTKLIFTINNQ